MSTKNTGKDVTITFVDGSTLVVDQYEWEGVLDDVIKGHPNRIYERLKAERDRGNTDIFGHIHLFEAFDPKTITEIWKDDTGLNG